MTMLPVSLAAVRYFARTMAVPKSRRERLLHHVRRPRWRAPRPDDPLATLLFESLASEPLRGRQLQELRALSLLDEDQDGRTRLIALLFDAAGDVPFAIAKAQRDVRSGSLKPEAVALEQVAALLSPELRRTIPEVLRCETGTDGEVLIVSALRGRSAWFDMKSSLAPWRLVDRHFDAAAQWLASFHEQTRHDAFAAAKHGDFWAHNVLLDDGRRVGVVDWENFAKCASRFADLFHYPLTYGLAYPWRMYLPLPAGAAFAQTFLARNRVSRAVRRYLERYAARTGIAWQDLRTAFREFLATRGTMNDSSQPLPGVRQLPWASFAAQIDAAKDSVFS